jgi:FkbM family methyltransferase
MNAIQENGSILKMITNLSKLFRQLPLFKGKRRLGSFLFKKEIANSKDLQISGKYGCQYLLPNLREAVALDVFLDGIYEPQTHDFLMSKIPPNAVLLDAGANIGSVCIPILKRRKDVTCICVEASPFVFNYLKKNISLNNLESQTICINKAITDKDGEVLPFYSEPSNFGKGSLSAVFTDKPVMVETITVSELMNEQNIERIDFIKADIEGYEFFAFKGCDQLLKGANAPAILFEFVDWAEQNAKLDPGMAQQFIINSGYDLYLLDSVNELNKLEFPLSKESAMLFATKK